MKRTVESKETFEWELNEGIITAVVTVKNGATEVEEFKVSRKNDGCTFVIKKEVDLIDIHKAMGQLIQEIDNKRGVGRTAEKELTAIARDKPRGLMNPEHMSVGIAVPPMIEGSGNKDSIYNTNNTTTGDR